MNYDLLGYDVIEKSKYPNLLAEIKESGYSICTVSTHMGHNPHVSEDDPDTWNKLLGREDILVEECVGLVHLFNVSYEYLFAPHLEKVFILKTSAFLSGYLTHFQRVRFPIISFSPYMVQSS